MTDGLGLGDAYDATAKQIQAQSRDKSRLRIVALMICHSERPLEAGELRHTLVA